MPQVKFYQHKESTLPKWAREKLEQQRREITSLKKRNAELVAHVETNLTTEIATIKDIHTHGRVLTSDERKTNRQLNEMVGDLMKTQSKKNS
jgi:hypothetical protein